MDACKGQSNSSEWVLWLAPKTHSPCLYHDDWPEERTGSSFLDRDSLRTANSGAVQLCPHKATIDCCGMSRAWYNSTWLLNSGVTFSWHLQPIKTTIYILTTVVLKKWQALALRTPEEMHWHVVDSSKELEISQKSNINVNLLYIQNVGFTRAGPCQVETKDSKFIRWTLCRSWWPEICSKSYCLPLNSANSTMWCGRDEHWQRNWTFWASWFPSS